MQKISRLNNGFVTTNLTVKLIPEMTNNTCATINQKPKYTHFDPKVESRTRSVSMKYFRLNWTLPILNQNSTKVITKLITN